MVVDTVRDHWSQMGEVYKNEEARVIAPYKFTENDCLILTGIDSDPSFDHSLVGWF